MTTRLGSSVSDAAGRAAHDGCLSSVTVRLIENYDKHNHRTDGHSQPLIASAFLESVNTPHARRYARRKWFRPATNARFVHRHGVPARSVNRLFDPTPTIDAALEFRCLAYAGSTARLAG